MTFSNLMRIVISGATGFVGKELCLRLLEEGDTLIVLSRDSRKAKQSLPKECEFFDWDAEKEEAPQKALESADTVIFLSGESVFDGKWTPEKKKRIYDSRILGLKNLRAAVAKISKDRQPKTLVSASAIGFYGDRLDKKLDESANPGDGFLADVCVDWEKEALSFEALGLRVVCIRIGIVLGLQGGMLRQILPIFKKGLGGKIGSGAQWMSWIHVKDLVSLISWSAKENSAHGVINGVAPEPVTNAEFTRKLASVLHRPAFFSVPAFALKLGMGEKGGLALESQRVYPKKTLSMGFSFRFSKVSEALKDIVS